MPQVTLQGLTKQFRRSGVVVDGINLEIEQGEFFTLLGPSGCGKSTTLRMIAGFEEPTKGSVLFQGRDVTWMPPNKRDVGLVFQNYALFPHMTVEKNVAFGLAAHKVPRPEADTRVAEALDLVQLSGLGKARVDELSGGQQQRVALARAIVIKPQLLLLDEPLSNLDAKLREETRSALRRIHQDTGLTSIYVTHDQAEALSMSSRIAVMSLAHIEQVGTPREVYERPATRFVAAFLGRNNIWATTVDKVAGDDATFRIGDHTFTGRASHSAPGLAVASGAKVNVCVRAEQVDLAPAAGAANSLDGTIADVEYTGAALAITLETPIGSLLCDLDGHVQVPSVGERLKVVLPADALYFLAPDKAGDRDDV